jgi:hypothetical protein
MSRKTGSFNLRGKPILIILVVLTAALILNTFYASAKDTSFTSQYPTKNSTITISNPKISAYVKSTNELNSSNVNMKLNNTSVPASFIYKGKWVNDY